MKKYLAVLAILLTGFVTQISAQNSLPTVRQYDNGLSRFYKKTTLTTTPTVVTASVAFIDALHLANKSTSLTVKVTIVDAGTDCAGSYCTIWPTITILPNQVYTTPLYGIESTGITWYADTASAVDAQIDWRQ